MAYGALTHNLRWLAQSILAMEESGEKQRLAASEGEFALGSWKAKSDGQALLCLNGMGRAGKPSAKMVGMPNGVRTLENRWFFLVDCRYYCGGVVCTRKLPVVVTGSRVSF